MRGGGLKNMQVLDKTAKLIVGRQGDAGCVFHPTEKKEKTFMSKKLHPMSV